MGFPSSLLPRSPDQSHRSEPQQGPSGRFRYRQRTEREVVENVVLGIGLARTSRGMITPDFVITSAVEVETQFHCLSGIGAHIHREVMIQRNPGIPTDDIWQRVKRSFVAPQEHPQVIPVIEESQRLGTQRDVTGLGECVGMYTSGCPTGSEIGHTAKENVPTTGAGIFLPKWVSRKSRSTMLA